MDGLRAALKAVAEPRRQAILRLLKSEGSQTPTDLGERLQITQQAASLHLKTLLEAGLVDERRDGTRRLYRARPEGLAELRDYLEDLWDSGLSRLKAAAEREARKDTLRDTRSSNRKPD